MCGTMGAAQSVAQQFSLLRRGGGGGGLTPPAPSDPDFIVGKHQILQTEVLIGAVFGTQPFGLLGSRTPPPPLKENSGAGRSRSGMARGMAEGRWFGGGGGARGVSVGRGWGLGGAHGAEWEGGGGARSSGAGTRTHGPRQHRFAGGTPEVVEWPDRFVPVP